MRDVSKTIVQLTDFTSKSHGKWIGKTLQ